MPISNRLMSSRREIVKTLGSDNSKVRPLLDQWLLEAKQADLMPGLSAMYSVLPWEQYGHLGTGVMLLFTARLFKSKEERQKCRESVKVSDREFAELFALADGMMKSKQMVEVSPDVKKLMDSIVSSTYFNAEHSGSLVLGCLEGMLERCWGSDRRQLLKLRDKLQYLYTPTEDETVFGYYDWKHIKPGALTLCRSGVRHARAIATGVINVEEKVGLLTDCWPACLAAMTTSPFVKDLLTARPPKSTVPHSHALLDCIEHTWLWMIMSKIDVYSTVPGVKYIDLEDCNKADLYNRFKSEVLPREVEKNLHNVAIVAYLKGAPEPDVYHGTDKAALKSIHGSWVLKLDYASRGFDVKLFPLESTAWVARDAQDLDDYTRKNCWLWEPTFLGLYLHQDLLLEGGVDDEELDFQVWQDIGDYYAMESERNYDRIRDNDVPKRVNPEEAIKMKNGRDIIIPPGRDMQSWLERRRQQKQMLASGSETAGALAAGAASGSEAGGGADVAQKTKQQKLPHLSLEPLLADVALKVAHKSKQQKTKQLPLPKTKQLLLRHTTKHKAAKKKLHKPCILSARGFRA